MTVAEQVFALLANHPFHFESDDRRQNRFEVEECNADDAQDGKD